VSFRYLGAQLGLLFLVLSAALGVVGAGSVVAWASGHAEEARAWVAILLTAGIGAVVGAGLWLSGRRAGGHFGRREAMLLVAASWLFGAALAALPYRLWAVFETDWSVHDDAFRTFVNCYFESMSGFTTTGATVLQNIRSIPPSLILWRAMTHWLGGLGIVVLFVAVLPSLGVGGKRVFRIESPGPTPEGVRPKIQETARVLWLIYMGLSAAETLCLKLLGLSWYEALCHTFATLATGGFSTRDGSVGELQSGAIEVVIMIFMILAGVNFGIYYHLIRKRWRLAAGDPELRAYLLVLAVGTVLIVINLAGHTIVTTAGDAVPQTLGSALHYAVFQVISIQTTTGFCTADFDRWPDLAKVVLVLLMFVGASAGSTGGGIKIVRCLILVKVLWAEIERVFRPNVVRAIKIGNTPLDPHLPQATLAYVLTILVLFVGGAAALLLLEEHQGIDTTTALTASAATLNNIGPGLARVGAVENYAWFGTPSKLVLSLLMVLGRLELYAILVLFVPRFWLRE
jgi:trk system potassium uptake protein TrkH